MRIAFVDLETTDLVANYGIVICGCVRELNKKTYTFRIDDSPGYNKRRWNDKWVVKQLRDCIEQFDVIITFYGKRFDKPFLNTRLLIHGLRPLIKQKHHDYWYTSKYRLKLRNNRQMTVASAMLGKNNKTAIDPLRWLKAMSGDRKAISYIVDHCQRDVRDLERIHGKLKIFMPVKLKRT